MKIKVAVTMENGQVFGHFGRSPEFLIAEVDGDKIVSETIAVAKETGHQAMAVFLYGLDVSVLLCGGIGGCAMEQLDALGIEVIGGCEGEAHQVLVDYVKGTLSNEPNFMCNHNHGSGHRCGGGCSGCGGHCH